MKSSTLDTCMDKCHERIVHSGWDKTCDEFKPLFWGNASQRVHVYKNVPNAHTIGHWILNLNINLV